MYIYCLHTLSIIVEVLYLETAVPNTKDFTTDSVTDFGKLSKLLFSIFFFQASVNRWWPFKAMKARRREAFVRRCSRSQTFIWSGR